MEINYFRTLRVIIPLFLSALLSLAQSNQTTGQVRGIVTDPSGAGIPGATLTIRDLATGIEKKTTSGNSGEYTFLELQSGKYRLTVSKEGFDQAVVDGITVDTGRVTDQTVRLTVGAVSNTVQVSGSSTALETSSNQVATTVKNEYVQDLPISGRDTLPFATLMAGSQAVGNDNGRTSTFNGLPNASMNIELDGMNNNSQRFRSGGTSFFEFAPARLDAIEEVTVATTGNGADTSGGGAMNIQLVTKRGTDQYHWKVFEQFQNDDLNANLFINNARGLPINKVRHNDFGGSFGGPLPIPFVPYFKHKLFFFVNFEATPLPGSTIETATVLTPQAQQGNFSYIGTDNQVHTANVLNLAAAAGFSKTIDPTVSGMLSQMNSTLSRGVVQPSTTNLYQNTLQWNQATTNNTIYPTARVDYQITPSLEWHGSWNLRHNSIAGVPQFPGLDALGNAYKITTYVASNNLDWTITPSLLNSLSFGIQSNGEFFNKDTSVNQWAPFGNRYINLNIGTTDLLPDQTPFIRNNPVYQLRDNLTWQKGPHTITMGGNWLHSSFWETTWNAPGGGGVPTYTLGIDPTDPINAVFNSSNLPFITTNDLANAAQLYATLTGRISSIVGGTNVDENTKQYLPFAPVTQRFAYSTGGIFLQDSYKVRPNLTFNYGFRWNFTSPIKNTNGIDFAPDMANFFGPSNGPFQPGVFSGITNPVMAVRPETYSGDWIQPAPNAGIAWNPNFDSGPLHAIFGHNTVIRASYGINFYNEGMNTISNVLSSNGGSTNTLSLQPGQAGFTPGGLTLQSPAPGLIAVPQAFAPTLPESDFTFNNGLNGVNPNLRAPYVQNWTVGIQRELAKNTVLEVRYVGNKATHVWHFYNAQETNIFENGFLQEFTNAQNNLRINQAAGVASFANRGLPGQVPLPIFQAAFGPNGTNPAMPSSFTAGSLITDLQQGQAGAMANTLATNLNFFCRMVGSNFSPCLANGFTAPGAYPINFFQPNPYAIGSGTNSGLFFQDDNGNTNYNALQVELRKSLSNGFSINANYTYSHTLGNIFNLNDQTATSQVRTLRNQHLDYGPTPFDIRHVFQAYWTYTPPIGPGRAINIHNALANRILGGWTISGIYRITSGHVFQLVGGTGGTGTAGGATGGTTAFNTVNNLTDSGVVLNGITVNQLQGMFNQIGNSPNRSISFVNPQLVGPDGRANPKFVSPAMTPGQFGSFVYLYGPRIFSADMALTKDLPLTEHLKFGFQAEALNVFNHPVFGAVPAGTTAVSITSTSFGQTTTQVVNPRSLQFRAYLQW